MYCITNKILKQAVVLKHNKPRPRVAHRSIARFLGIDNKCNQVVPWSLRTFPKNFTQISPAAFSRNLADKETKKEINKQRNNEIDRKQYPVPDTIGGWIKKRE